jgi:hypothetical protein
LNVNILGSAAEPQNTAPAPTPVVETVAVPEVRHISIDRKATLRGQKINLLALNESYAAFPPVSGKIPQFKAASRQYPSGNITGTESFKPFENKLRDLMLGL